MLDVLFTDTRQLAEEWERQARERRGWSTIDPIADTLERCAKALRQRVQDLDHGLGYLTPAQYAALCVPRVSVPTVLTWIKKGQLAATQTPTGWAIRRDAKRRSRAS